MKLHPPPRLAIVMLIACGVGSAIPAHAVRVSADGLGQALIYPYYTARTMQSGNAYVTALTVTNTRSKPKAVKVRFLEGRMGAEVLDFNLYLDAHDVWTAGIVAAGPGAGLFTKDHTCTSPVLSADPANPTRFGNRLYVGDLLGDSLDRTYEGYFEVLEMGVIDPESNFGSAVTHSPDFSKPNASRAACVGLPLTDVVPAGVSKPSGGLAGNVSYLNINEGTDFSVDATVLSEWSDKVQWSAAGNAHPNLADASPAVSFVIDGREDGDIAYITRWEEGRDAVSALFMAERIINDFTVEPAIKAASDWILAMPTKRFYVRGTSIDRPFAGRSPESRSYCEELRPIGCGNDLDYAHDRESQYTLGFDVGVCFPDRISVCGAVAVWTWDLRRETTSPFHLFPSPQSTIHHTTAPYIQNGWGKLFLETSSANRMVSPIHSTTIVDLKSGIARTRATVAYVGRPVVGFAGQSYSTTGLPGVSPNVLSNYGGQFNHKVGRRIEAAP